MEDTGIDERANKGRIDRHDGAGRSISVECGRGVFVQWHEEGLERVSLPDPVADPVVCMHSLSHSEQLTI